MPDLIEKARLSTKDLISPGDKVLVAVSGGIDSMALLYLLVLFSKEMGYELFIAHINHLARGDESDEDERFVENIAESLSIPFFVERVDVSKEKHLQKSSFQETARNLRYEFLEKVLVSIKGNKIAVGHNADDQVESILMNLMRGAGMKGLAGIPKYRGNVVRPLLDCNRFELKQYLDNQNISFRSDESNDEKKYLRNKVRHDLIPLLKTFNNEFSRNLINLGEIAREEDDWMTGVTCGIYSQLVIAHPDKKRQVFNISQFNEQPQAFKKRLIREALNRLKGDLRSIGSLHVRQVLDLFSKARVGSWLKLPGNVRVDCDYETISLSINEKKLREDDASLAKINVSVRLKVPGVTNLSDGGIQLHARIMNPSEVTRESMMVNQACFDFDLTGGLIQARYFQPGDTFVPLGMDGHKKLKSFFIDRKIPKNKRTFVPILTNSTDDIIWVYGERISGPFRITEKTRKVLFIEGIEP